MSNNSEEKIKCCPFCGGSEVEVCRTNARACWIRCESCDARANSAALRKTAIKNWNNRPEPDAEFATVVFDGDADYQKRLRIIRSQRKSVTRKSARGARG